MPASAAVEKGACSYCSKPIHTSCGEIRDVTDSQPIITVPRFTKQLSLMANHGVLRKDFNKLEMPENFDADEARSVLTAIRQPQAIHYYDVVYTHSNAVNSWFTPTYRFMKTLRRLASRHRIGRAARHRFIVRALIEEAMATLGCNGLDVNHETARTLIAAEQEPANFHRLHSASRWGPYGTCAKSSQRHRREQAQHTHLSG